MPALYKSSNDNSIEFIRKLDSYVTRDCGRGTNATSPKANQYNGGPRPPQQLQLVAKKAMDSQKTGDLRQ